MKNLAVLRRLDSGADLFIAEQTHFAKYFALLQGGDAKAVFIEDRDLA